MVEKCVQRKLSEASKVGCTIMLSIYARICYSLRWLEANISEIRFSMSEKPKSGSPFPCFTLDRIGGGRIVLGGEREHWQLVVVYPGRHCQPTKPFLARLNSMTASFAEQYIDIAAISADRHDQAVADAQEFGWTFEVGYGLTLETMRGMGLYISEPRSALEPDRPYSEPAQFALSPRGTADIINISNSPFSFPDLDGVLSGITFIQIRDYAAGGTLD